MSSSPTTLKVLVFAASLRAESLNRKLAALARGSPSRTARLSTCVDARLRRLLYDGDVETEWDPVWGEGAPTAASGERRLHHLVP